MGKQSKNPKLRSQDWIDLATDVLTSNGIDAVRVEPLAKRLKVTKGSFYWHFKNRSELLKALLENWVSQETEQVIVQVEAECADASAKLLRLFELAVQDSGQVENAIRAWAVSDSKVAEVVVQVDQRRLEYTRSLFAALGFAPADALLRARMAYYALVGEFTIGTRANHSERLLEIREQYKILARQD